MSDAPVPAVETARALVQALIDLGVTHVVAAPGSRSAPFVPLLAAAQRQGLLAVRVVLDERSAGFTALGIGRAALLDGERRPAAVLTTSGTAVANLHPAVLEADAAGVPLLVISADRPHELVGTGANQTTEQTRIFGGAVRAVVDLPADLPRDLGPAAEAAISGQVRRALEAASGRLSRDPGPAQLNVRLRPPLTADPGGRPSLDVPVLRPPHSESAAAAAPPVPSAPPAPRPMTEGAETPAATTRGVVVAGDGAAHPSGWPADLAADLGWPLLAEPTSGARRGRAALTRYAELLATPGGRRLAGQIEHLVVVGRPSLTRAVSALLARRDVPIDVVTSTPRWTDVAGTAARVTAVDPAHEDPVGTAGRIQRDLGLSAAPPAWLEAWHAAVAALPALDEAGDRLTADAAALAVYEASLGGPAPAPASGAPVLVVGSSMTVRRLDRVAPVGALAAPRAVANRGLAGIDGTLATALGVHLGVGEPVRAVVGDLTFLHDAMSLGRGRLEREPDLQVVVLDDAGGAIFSTLEYPAVTAPEVLARFFSTPQRADVGALAAALGARVERPTSLSGLRAVLARPVVGLSVVHVPLHVPLLPEGD